MVLAWFDKRVDLWLELILLRVSTFWTKVD